MDSRVKVNHFFLMSILISSLFLLTMSFTAPVRAETTNIYKPGTANAVQVAYHRGYRHRGYRGRGYRGRGLYYGPGYIYYGPRYRRSVYWTGWYRAGRRCQKRCLVNRWSGDKVRCVRRCR